MSGEQYLNDGRSDGAFFGQSATDLIGFFGTTPVVQPSGAAQDAISTTSSDATTLGLMITLVNKIRTDLVALGLQKGSS